MALLVWSIFQIFLPPGPVQNTILSLLGSILFSAYIVYDTDNLIQREPSPCLVLRFLSDYAVLCECSYNDVLNIPRLLLLQSHGRL